METETPSVIEMPRATDNVQAYIAVAVVWYPEAFNLPANVILKNALEAGLRRKPVRIAAHGGYFKNVFSVSVFTIDPAEKASALKALKETLAELKLLELSTIAVRTAEEIWLTIHGLGIGGMTFDQTFLRSEDIAAAKAESESLRVHAEFMWKAFIEDWKRTHPEQSGDTDSK